VEPARSPVPARASPYSLLLSPYSSLLPLPRRPSDDQPGLFPEDAPPKPLLQQPECEELAAKLPDVLRLGTSSWTFPGWKGLVYEESKPCGEAILARDGLEQYARSPLLRTVGLDRAFYRPMTVEQCRALGGQSGSDFRFLVKAYRGLTHRAYAEPVFLDAAYARDIVIAPLVEGFGGSLGTLLFQFPEMGLSARDGDDFLKSLDRFLAALPSGVPYSVELRDRVLLSPRTAAMLMHHGIAFGHALHPSMPSLAEQTRLLGPSIDEIAAPAVLRWLLRREHSYEGAKTLYEPFDRLLEPDAASRDGAVAWCLAQAFRGRETFVIANNKAEGSSPLTLLELAKAIVASMGPAS
jgi:uncharacterized protein YecE (DUF72 family)